jgi:hypothetical protein
VTDALKQHTVFLVEKEVCTPRPDCLKGFTPTKFWFYDDMEGIVQLTGEAYFTKANELAAMIANRLIELKEQYNRQKNLNEERHAETKPAVSIPATVFLDCAPEDLELSRQIKSLLKQNGVECVLESVSYNDSPENIRKNIELRISTCDAVLVLYEHTTAFWATKQITDCLRLHHKHETSFKVVAIHKSQNQPDLGVDWNLLKTYNCPPEQIETYLPRFIEALK